MIKNILLWHKRRKVYKECKYCRKALLHYLSFQKDVLREGHYNRLKEMNHELKVALVSGRVELMKESVESFHRSSNKLFPQRSFEGVRQNLETILVAVIFAFAIKAYFFQPFKIPTASMEPTLYGINVEPTDLPFPAFYQKIFDAVLFGESYHEATAEQDGEIVGIKEGKIGLWFSYTDLIFDSGKTQRLWSSSDSLKKMGVTVGKSFKKGESIARYIEKTGDQLLVNKMFYHFRKPKRGEVFVFKTTNISRIEMFQHQRGVRWDQHYIKRCVGIPGDELRIDSPFLMVNGKPIDDFPILTTLQNKENGYGGYGGYRVGQFFLKNPNETVKVPPVSYWAMGDNSYNSEDSRFWGRVPEENLVGNASFVFWPLGKRWGFIQ